MKAFRATVDFYPGNVGIYQGETPGKVRYRVVLALENAGWRGHGFSDIDVRRAPDFDHLAVGLTTQNIGWKDGVMSWGCLKEKPQ